jgi:hypothetical protein
MELAKNELTSRLTPTSSCRLVAVVLVLEVVAAAVAVLSDGSRAAGAVRATTLRSRTAWTEAKDDESRDGWSTAKEKED